MDFKHLDDGREWRERTWFKFQNLGYTYYLKMTPPIAAKSKQKDYFK